MSTRNEINTLLSSYPEQVRQIADAARTLVMEVCVGVNEGVDLAAKLVSYSYGPGYKGTVCTLIMSKKGVKLGIPYGASLSDPAALLQGSGNIHRCVAFSSLEDVRRLEVRELAERAVEAWRSRNENDTK